MRWRGRAVRPRAAFNLKSDSAMRFDIERIERMRCGNEQPIVLGPAESQIGTPFGEADEANCLALRVVDHHAVKLFGFGRGRAVAAEAAPKIAVRIDPEAIERTRPVGVDQF